MRVVLYEDSIEVFATFRRRSYPRSEFVEATWAKGSPVALKFKDGSWLKLPPVGSGSAQGVVNTLRAWIKK
ncbi:MAG TPA: hypothetical protein VGL10_01690 [Gammaproteobacteria bacterium]